MIEPVEFEKSSGNVFSDIGLPDAADHLVKAKLVFKIDAHIHTADGSQDIGSAHLAEAIGYRLLDRGATAQGLG